MFKKTITFDFEDPDWSALLDFLGIYAYIKEVAYEAIPRWEDDGGSVYDEEEGRTRCQISS